MQKMKMTRWTVLLGLILIGCAATSAPDRRPPIDESQPYLEFKLTYNYAVYEKPSIFLPKSQPTFAIWLQEKSSGNVQTIYVTGKAAENKWILAEARPESIPVWYGVRQKEPLAQGEQVDAISGATPSGDTVVIQWQVPQWLRAKRASIFIEANSSYDYNAYYSDQKDAAGYSGANGQPSLVWKAELDFSKNGDEEILPEIIGHGHLWGKDHKIYADISRVTTARETFSYMAIQFFSAN
ncbi:MAG: hypothetical protein PVI38_06190 [Desulfobacterales bacterium]|jgi:hypothetical protein